MKKYLFSIIIIFSTLFSFNELGRNMMQIDFNHLKSNTAFDQHIEDDTAELDISLDLNNISISHLSVTRSAPPLIKNTLTIWKPPVNA